MSYQKINYKSMKLPEVIEGIHREGRADSFGYVRDAGVEPLFLGSVWKGIKKVAQKVIPVACLACNASPHPIAKAACLVACR